MHALVVVHSTVILFPYIYIPVDSMFSASSVFQTDNACQLWDAKTELNKLQREAIEHGVKRSFQLIQGPPGIEFPPILLLDVLGQQFSSCLRRDRQECYWSSSCIHIGQVEWQNQKKRCQRLCGLLRTFKQSCGCCARSAQNYL